jgi:HEAT repeat protein
VIQALVDRLRDKDWGVRSAASLALLILEKQGSRLSRAPGGSQ